MKRIQRKRTRGWRMPANAVYVGRPTRWGNPYAVTHMTKLEDSLRLYRWWLAKKLNEDPEFLEPLRDKDLACWCSLVDKEGNSVPCHADILIEVMEKRGMT